MSFKNFVTPHCHVKSLDSASTPEQFAKRELELGTGYLTVTDHGTLEATRQVYDLTKNKKAFKGLKPILGVEGYFRDDECPILTAAGVPFSRGKKGDEAPNFRDHLKYMHLTLHALDEKGYYALSRVISDADLRAERHGSERKPLFTWANLEDLGAHNVTVTSGCLIGMVSRHILQHNDAGTAVKYYERLRSCFKPGNFYVEIFPHVCDRNWDSGIFVKTVDGQEKKFAAWKQFKTKSGIIKAEDLAEAFKRAPDRARTVHGSIFEVMENKVWTQLPVPMQLENVEKREGFIINECRPWCPDGDVQRGTNLFLARLAQKYGDPILIGDDSHFAYPEEKIVQDIRLGQNGGAWRFANSYHRQSSDEAWLYFRDRMGVSDKEFESWIENSYNWAHRFDDFKFNNRKTLPTSFYPADTLRYTMDRIQAHGRMDWNNPQYVARLKAEIELLYRNGTVDLLPYFAIDEEVCRFYARNGLLTGPGRGSAAGLLLTYLLGITHVDPLRFGLSMDRFMTLDRVQTGKLPDIDQDLSDRTPLLGTDTTPGWLRKRFGDNVAQISTDISIKLKMAIKDTFRAQRGFVPPDIEILCKALPNPPQGIPDRDYVFGYKDNDGHWQPGLIETNAILQVFAQEYPKEWEVVKMLLGLSRQKGRHACAYVISDEPIKNFIPLMTVGDVRVTSFTAPAVEASGGLKMDFLGVNSLKDIGAAIRLIQDRHGKDIDWAPSRITDEAAGTEDREISAMDIEGKKVPHVRAVPFQGRYYDIWNLPEDPAVFRDICEGRVEAVFQLDAGAARQGLRHFAPQGDVLPLDSIEDLAAFTALDRPGPLDARVRTPDGTEHNMLVEFANRARGLARVGNLQILDELLPETHGVIVYQEQLQNIFQQVGGTTAIEANNFRQRISKKLLVDVNSIDKPLFMKGAVARLGAEAAESLWNMMETFGQYGFNKSHAVCYVTIGYACAWLKHHYPLEWWTAVLSNADRNEIDEKFWRYCGKYIDLPDIRLSQAGFSIQGDRIRAPLSLLHGLGEKAHNQLMAGAPYTSIEDLLLKIEAFKTNNPRFSAKTGKATKGTSAINSSVVQNLIISGAMDSLFPEYDSFGLPLTVIDRLSLYAEAAAKIQKRRGGAGLASRYNLQSGLVQYQLRKKILPAYSKSLTDEAAAGSLSQLFEKRGEHTIINHDRNEWKLVSGRDYEYLNAMTFLPGENKVAVVGYVVTDRRFSYLKKDTGETKTAADLTIDIDGIRFSVVRWPSKTGLPAVFDQSLEGSVIVCFMSRNEDSRSFFFTDAIVLAPPVETTKKEEDSPDAEATP